jgi:hypothetical protein
MFQEEAKYFRGKQDNLDKNEGKGRKEEKTEVSKVPKPKT